VEDGRPHGGPFETVFTGPPIAEEESVGAEKTVVVERLDQRDFLGGCRGVHRGRKQRKGVMCMDHIGSCRSDHLAQFTIRPPIPRRPCGQLERAIVAHVTVVSRELRHVVPVTPQQSGFRCHDAILASGLLVVVVYLHHAG
jgi:hypothetical protein